MLSTCFVFAQQYIISGGKCAVSEREIKCPKVGKNEIWAECTDQKLINNLSLAWQFCLRWLPRVFTNNPSYLAYDTKGNLVTLSLRFGSRNSPISLPM